ncbi:hypothetical protein sscle_04g033620 [Sclerotinia sclerotiorum 1980 UF-70]|uniref:Aromatic amino acid beta-eliminating lyase/threonine aldolase domain-containing protein n=1 Tax=Sclerotinia sclerotiorum (strain ATCC 18683 / 1980 / Ss-1) TaxID=665079 RepID=A0A1D9Q1A4_SCLS1|nr:hypothetical protein sscle_04g033620 [Sclerotinia sclerotiorum 1980 UF-70]
MNGSRSRQVSVLPMTEFSAMGAAWMSPGPAGFDFRSDICTGSHPVMLQAIFQAGENDGWTASGASEFEADMAKLTGREATMFMVSSTMANQVALRSHLGTPPYSVLCDVRSHLVHMEAGGAGSWAGALVVTVVPSNGLWLTLDDIQRYAVISDGSDACTCPTKLIHLEVPLGGIVMPLRELKRISHWAKAKNIAVHLDGARLWEAVSFGAGTLHQYCALPDTINLCLTKGLGGAVGSLLVGNKAHLKRAKWIRKTVGGSMRQPGFLAAAAAASVKHVWGNKIDGSNSLLKPCHEKAARLASTWTSLGGRLLCPQQTNMIWLDLDHAGIAEEEWESEGLKRGIKLHSCRIIVHFQITDGAMDSLQGFMTDMLTQIGKGPSPLNRRIPRNEAVSRVARAMQEAWSLISAEAWFHSK